MDPKFLDYYSRELRHLAEMCGEFAQEYPKIAGRLSLEGFIKEFQCPDPYVERLLEGFAYMAARVQLKVDAEYPRFSQALLDMVYPDYLAPVPSMGIVRFEPDMTQGSLNDGIPVKRGAVLRSKLGRDIQTPCEYRTAHDVTLWPIVVAEARYFSSAGAVAGLGLAASGRARAALRLRLKTVTGIPMQTLALDSLVVYLRGGDQVAMQLYEQLMANARAVVARAADKAEDWQHVLPAGAVGALGFNDTEALLPVSPRSFHGYRLLREYFAFPERFMFATVRGLAPAVKRCTTAELDIYVLFDRSLPQLEEAIEASRFQLFCTPAINLFPKRTDRIHLNDQTNEYHIVADRSRPLDFEIHSLTEVFGYGTGTDPEQEFLPFYACNDSARDRYHDAYYSVFREPRVLSSRQKLRGPRSSYVGSEAFVALVDAHEAPFASSLRQLGLVALCTNRDLPLLMPVGADRTDLSMEIGAPVESTRFLAGPTEPRPSIAHREIAWKLISHLSLNYLSLSDDPPSKASGDRGRGEPGSQHRPETAAALHQGAAALRELLDLYATGGDPTVRAHVEGLMSVRATPIERRLPVPGPVTIARGLEVKLTLDETPFTGTGPFLLGAVIEQFLARYVSLNAFTETVLLTPARGEVMRWPARIGQRQLL